MKEAPLLLYFASSDCSLLCHGHWLTLGWRPRLASCQGDLRMTFQARLLCAVAGASLAVWAATAPAQALTMQECSAKYKAAKDAGTLNGQKWNDFRKAQCGADATTAAAPAAAPAPAPAAAPAAKE